jgi:uncharacterized membrane protein YgcG
MARYVYLLNTLPASVIESAHAEAFRAMTPEKRAQMFAELRPFMAESERNATADDSIVLARLLRRAQERKEARAQAQTQTGPAATTTLTADPRDAVDPDEFMRRVGIMPFVANNFLAAAAVSVYFTSGAGSLTMDTQPGWVGETYDPGAYGGSDVSGGGFGGDGGFGGGFDGGGFGGGFDGGGGFGG